MASDKPQTNRIIALIDGGPADEPVIEMACLLARHKEAQLYIVRAIMVERTLPLDASLPEASQGARAVLVRAQRAAARYQCAAQTRELRTRDIATALVDEAADLGCNVIVLGFAGEQRGIGSPMAIAEQVMRHAACPVWVYRGRATFG